MPTVTLPATVAPVPVVEAEVVAAAVRFAEGNDLAAARRTLDAVPDPAQRTRLGAEIVTKLAAGDPRRAAEFALGLTSAASQAAGLEIAARALVQRDPDEALRWALGVSDAAVAGPARAAIARQLVQVNARQAVDRIVALPPGPARDETLGFAAAAWARTDANAAVAWLRTLPENELHRRLTATVAFEIAQKHPGSRDRAGGDAAGGTRSLAAGFRHRANLGRDGSEGSAGVGGAVAGG